MAKLIPDGALDAALDWMADSERVVVTSSQPANYAAVAGVALGDVAVDSGDFSKADGDVSGRKLVVAAQSFNIDATGTVTHAVLVDDTASAIRGITTVASQPVTSGNPANLGSFKFEIPDVA